MPHVAEGSEHAVYVRAAEGIVLKTTLPGTYGDSYYLVNGKVHQRNCSPLDYLSRMHFWAQVLEAAPVPLGIMAGGQIVTEQRYIQGEIPTQAAVDGFLRTAGWEAVRQNCFLWKLGFPEYEIWLGDARDENFVETPLGIVPIDVRMWFVPKRSAA